MLTAGAAWTALERLMQLRLRKTIAALNSVTTREDWPRWLSDAAGICAKAQGYRTHTDTIQKIHTADAEGVWALSELAEAMLDRDRSSQLGHEILTECALRITTLCSSQMFFSHDPWRLAIAATVYARNGLRTKAKEVITRIQEQETQYRVFGLHDRQLIGYFYLLRVLRNYRHDTSTLQTVAVVQLEVRIMRTLDEDGTAALPIVLPNRTAAKAAERIMQGTAPVTARRIAAWALARGTEC
jgi:hypothetical protein